MAPTLSPASAVTTLNVEAGVVLGEHPIHQRFVLMVGDGAVVGAMTNPVRVRSRKARQG